MHLFLTGARGVGKSTLLREALSPFSDGLSGFVVQRLTENGTQAGFRVATLEDGFPPLEAPYRSGQSGVFILRGQWDISSLEKAVAQAETASRAPHCKLLLLDEIGGIELASPVFMSALRRILSGETPCIGVFKSLENMKHTASVLQLDREYSALHQNLEGYLRAHGKLLVLREDNRINVSDAVTGYLRETSDRGQGGWVYSRLVTGRVFSL